MFEEDLYAQSVLFFNKISASELSRKFIKSALLVGQSVKDVMDGTLFLSRSKCQVFYLGKIKVRTHYTIFGLLGHYLPQAQILSSARSFSFPASSKLLHLIIATGCLKKEKEIFFFGCMLQIHIRVNAKELLSMAQQAIIPFFQHPVSHQTFSIERQKSS